MPIIPSGKRRIMQAQSYSDQIGTEPALEQYRPDPMQQTPEQPATEQEVPAAETQVPAAEPQVSDAGVQSAQKEVGDGQEDLSEYVFKFLEERGYPPRRLEEFEDEFVQEKIFSGNNREVTVVLPDRYYGTKKRFSDKDINHFVKNIADKFQLSFVDAERKDKKFTINFSSNAPQQGTEGIEPKDDLDVIFGNQGKSQEKSKQTTVKPAVAKPVKKGI